MARPRGGTALFDLLEDGAVTSHGASHPNGVKAMSEVPLRPATPTTPERPVVMGPIRTARDSGSAENSEIRSESGRKRAILEVNDDSVRVVLTSGRTAIVVFVLCAMLIATFEWGRRRGGEAGFVRGYDAGRESYAADTLSEIEAARQGAVTPGLVDDVVSGGSASVLSAFEQAVGREPNPSDDRVAWLSGHTYVVAQGFEAGRDADAEQAQAFLASRDIETVLIRFGSGAMQLITAQGFNRSDDAQRSLADRLLEDVHAAGRDYFASGGGYRLEGYFATFKGDRW